MYPGLVVGGTGCFATVDATDAVDGGRPPRAMVISCLRFVRLASRCFAAVRAMEASMTSAWSWLTPTGNRVSSRVAGLSCVINSRASGGRGCGRRVLAMRSDGQSPVWFCACLVVQRQYARLSVLLRKLAARRDAVRCASARVRLFSCFSWNLRSTESE